MADFSIASMIPLADLRLTQKTTKPAIIVSNGSSPSPPQVITYRNRVWDAVQNGFWWWDTNGFPDDTGSQYNGPGVWGVDTYNYTLIVIDPQ